MALLATVGNVVDNLGTSLAADCDSGDSLMTVVDATGLVAPCVLTVWNTGSGGTGTPSSDANMEIVLVTEVNGNVLTITRGLQDTIAADHVTGDVVVMLLTSYQMVALYEAIIACLRLDTSNGPLTNHLDVMDSTMEFATVGEGDEYNGIYSEQIKTAGDTGASVISAIRAMMGLNQAGANVTQLYGFESECHIWDGTPIFSAAIRASLNGYDGADMGDAELLLGNVNVGPGATAGNVQGVRSEVDIDGAVYTVNGLRAELAIGATGTVTFDAVGLSVSVVNGGAVGWTTYGIKLDDGAGVDFGIFQSGSAPNRLLGQLSVGATAPSVNYEVGAVNTGIICMKESTTPTDDSGYGKIYCKADNKLYFQDGAGVEHEVALDEEEEEEEE